MPLSASLQRRTRRSLRTLLNDAPLGIRIYLTAIAMVGVVAASFVLNALPQKEMLLVMNEMTDSRIPAMEHAFRIKELVSSHHNMVLTYLTTRDARRLADAEETKKIIDLELGQLKILTDNPVILDSLGQLEKGVGEYLLQVDGLILFAKSNELPKKAGWFQTIDWARGVDQRRREIALISAEGQAQMLRIASLCQEIVTLNRAELADSRRDMQRLQRKIRKASLITIAVSGFFVIFMALGLAYSLLGSLNDLLSGIKSVNEGNFDLEVPVSSSGILGRLMNEFNRMARTIRTQQERLVTQNITDELTGAHNQRFFRELLRREFERAAAEGRGLTLLMIDLDHFKGYNDTFGHEFGNEVLKRVALTVKDNLRAVDFLVRYGGDEFAALLPDAPAEVARDIALRLVEAVEQCRFAGQEAQSAERITLSIGGAAFPADAKSQQDLIDKADAALYEAKKAGKNRLAWAGGKS